VDQTVRPKPTKNWVTFMPNAFAGSMWPISCRATDARMPMTNSTIPMKVRSALMPV
jgi:hypothetical protein